VFPGKRDILLSFVSRIFSTLCFSSTARSTAELVTMLMDFLHLFNDHLAFGSDCISHGVRMYMVHPNRVGFESRLHSAPCDTDSPYGTRNFMPCAVSRNAVSLCYSMTKLVTQVTQYQLFRIHSKHSPQLSPLCVLHRRDFLLFFARSL
jgi:hypothetical protein